MQKRAGKTHPVTSFVNYFDQNWKKLSANSPFNESKLFKQLSSADFSDFLKNVGEYPNIKVSHKQIFDLDTTEIEGILANCNEDLRSILVFSVSVFICYHGPKSVPSNILEKIISEISTLISDEKWTDLSIFLGEKIIALLSSKSDYNWTPTLVISLTLFLQCLDLYTNNAIELFRSLLSIPSQLFSGDERDIITSTLISFFSSDKVPCDDLLPFITFVANNIEKLEKNDLVLLSLIAKLKFDSPIPEIIKVLPEYIWDTINRENPIFENSLDDDDEIFEKKSFGIKKTYKSFPNGFCYVPEIKMLDVEEFEKNFPFYMRKFTTSLQYFINGANQKTLECFYTSFLKLVLSKESSDHFVDLLVTFVFLFEQNPFKGITYEMFGKFIKLPYITQNCGIFSENKPELQYIRAKLTKIFYHEDKKLPMMTIIGLKDKPLACIDQIIRTFEIIPQFSLADTDFINEAGNILLRLQMMDTKGYSKSLSETRSTAMFFVNDLMKSKETVGLCLNSSKFIKAFLSLAFEEEITEAVTSIIEYAFILYNTLDNTINNIASFIKEVFALCETNKSDEHIKLCIMLQKTALEILMMAPEYSLLSGSLLDSAFDLLKYTSNEEAIKNSLLILRQFVIGSNFYLSPKFCREIAQQIITIGNYTESSFIYDTLIQLISKTTSIYSDSLFLIRNPSFIQLFVSVYGSSNRFHDILILFTNLCKYSINNTRACHDGYLDAFLLLFIKENKEKAEITFINTQIELEITKEDVDEIVLPLLTKICSTKSNYNISCIVSDILKSGCFDAIQRVSTILKKSIIFEMSNEKFSFPIGSFPSFMQIEGIKGSMFPGTIVFSLWIYASIKCMMLTGCTINLLSLKDEKGTKITFTLTGVSIHAIITSDNNETRCLVTSLSTKKDQWNNVIITVNRENKNDCFIGCHINRMMQGKSEFSDFSFEGPIKARVGGIVKNIPGYDGLITGFMGPVTIFDHLLKDTEIDKEYYRSFNESSNISCVVTTNMMSYKSLSGNYALDLYGNTFNFALSQIIANTSSLPVFVILGDVIPNLWKYFDNFGTSPIELDENVLSVINQLFIYNKSSQNTPSFPLELSKNLMKNPAKLTYNLYRQLYEIFTSITDQTVLYDWGDYIIFNPIIWCQNRNNEFYLIVKHWATVGIGSFHFLFKERIPFGRILSLFAGIFCDEFCITPEYLNGDNYQMAQKFYLLFLKRIARINLNVKDAEKIFVFAVSLSDKNKAFFLELLKDTADLMSKELIKKYIDLIAVIPFNTLPSTVLLISHLVHSLSGDTIHSRTMGLLMHIVNNGKTKNIVNLMIPTLKEYPNLIDVVCGLALVTNEETVERVSYVFDTEDLNISFVGTWFMWLVLFAFKAKNYKGVVKFIAKNCIKSRNPQVINRVARFIYLINESLPEPCDYVLVEFFKNFLNIQDEKIRNICSYLCAEFSLFHMSYDLHSDVILGLIEETYGTKYDPCNSVAYKADILNFGDLQRIFSNEKIKVEFRPIFKNSVWKDAILSDFAQKFGEVPELVYDLSMYIKKMCEGAKIKRDIHNDVLFATERVNSLAKVFFEKEKNEFSEVMLSSTKSLKNNLVNQPRIINEKSQKFVSKAFEQKKLISVAKEEKRINLFSTSFCPYEIRTFSAVENKCNATLPQSCNKLKCAQIKFNEIENATFCFDEKSFYIETIKGVKQIPFSIVSIITKVRRNNQETALQLYLVNRRMFLFDFAPITSDQVLSSMPFDKMKRVTVTQPFDSSFKNCQWALHPMSNFDYLIQLNIYSGRSFLDYTIYPMMPSLVLNKNEGFSYVAPHKNPRIDRLICKKHSTVEQELAKGSILPEHFFLPEIFDENELPKWSHSSFDYVYKMRKMIESDEVEPILYKWINATFGVSNMPHRKLFSSSHPKKFVQKNPAKAKQVSYTLDIDNKTVLFADVINNATFAAVLSDGAVIVIDFADIDGIIKEIGKIDPATVRVCHGSKKSFNVITDNHIFMYSRSKTHKDLFLRESILFSQLEDMFLFCETNYVIKCKKYKKGRLNQRTVCYSPDLITAISGNERFQMVVYGTVKSQIHFVTLHNSEEIPLTIDIPDVPRRIVITNGWGFVVVFTKSEVFVYTCNGKFIGSAKIEFIVTNEFSFTTYKGFDFVVFKQCNGKVFIFEAPYPEKMENICNDSLNLIKSIAFSNNLSSLIILEKSGKVKSISVSDFV